MKVDMRRLSPSLVLLLLAALVLPTVADAAKHHKKPQRRGGPVDKAWPRDRSDKAPDIPLAAWLAKQVGPVSTAAKAKTKTRRPQDGVTARMAATTSNALSLVRSFDIPTSDPKYNNLANLSWTYDNALAVLAFTDLGYRAQAQQLLDQLKALQLSNGSLAFAYDVKSGAGSGQIRSNALAWVGIAAVAYRDKYNVTTYDGMIAGLADYLLKSRRTDGLVLGGPDVQWVSTQHNLLMSEFFRSAATEFGARTIANGITGTQLKTAYDLVSNAITSKLLVQNGLTQAYFVQGLNDARIPLDTQTLGSAFLLQRGDARTAAAVGNFLVTLNTTPRTVNGTLWQGYKPFAGSASPDIVWSEGTVQADWAFHRLGVLFATAIAGADVATLGIANTGNGGTTGPLGASAAVDNSWGQFPAWPTSAAGSWLLIQAGGGDILFS